MCWACATQGIYCSQVIENTYLRVNPIVHLILVSNHWQMVAKYSQVNPVMCLVLKLHMCNPCVMPYPNQSSC